MCWFLPPEAGFLDEVPQHSSVLGPGYDRPYQLDPAVREPKSIQLYQHLNLKSCIWTFDAFYDMTELIDVCGGSVTADFQVRGAHPELPHAPQTLSALRHSSALHLGVDAALLCACHLEENSAVCIYLVYFPGGFISFIFRAPGKYLVFNVLLKFSYWK